MAGSDIQQNLIPNEPMLADLLNLFKKDLLLGFNCHHIGTIQSFNSVKQTATATINYKKTYFKPNSVTGLYDPVLVDYPVLLDSPVVCLGGGGSSLTFPIASGDECLVLFNDRDIDNWFSGSSNGAVATPRLHSFSDGIIVVGLRSMANVIINYNGDAVELRTEDGLTKVSLDDTTATIRRGTTTAVLTDDATTITVGANMTFEVDATGKFKITNATGEFVAALIQVFQTASAGGFPLIADLTTLLTFKE